MNKTVWIRVTKRNPCPICERTNWCGVGECGEVARCMRVESSVKSEGSDGSIGYIHKLTETSDYKRPIRRPQAPQPPKLTSQQIRAIWKDCARLTDCAALDGLAASLGVSRPSLVSLQVAKRDNDSWVFPMCSPTGEMIGLRIRTNDGKKYAERGGREGLFIPDFVDTDDVEPLLICEGPTDTAAAATLGIHAIGRPSCNGGVNLIQEFLSLSRRRPVIIIADRDTPKDRPDGSTWLPGQEGAERLAEGIVDLCGGLRIIKPNFPNVKDMRAWLNAGATWAIVKATITQKPLWTRKKK